MASKQIRAAKWPLPLLKRVSPLPGEKSASPRFILFSMGSLSSNGILSEKGQAGSCSNFAPPQLEAEREIRHCNIWAHHFDRKYNPGLQPEGRSSVPRSIPQPSPYTPDGTQDNRTFRNFLERVRGRCLTSPSTLWQWVNFPYLPRRSQDFPAPGDSNRDCPYPGGQLNIL